MSPYYIDPEGFRGETVSVSHAEGGNDGEKGDAYEIGAKERESEL